MNRLEPYRNGGLPLSAAAFREPPVELWPVYAWVWCDTVTFDGIRERLDAMSRAGIRGVYILPEPPEFRPNTMVTRMSPPYLSDEFFAMVAYALQYADSLGMQLWLYDEGGWPSGSACGHVIRKDPSTARKGLAVRETVLSAGDRYAPDDDVLCAFSHDVRVFPGFRTDEDVTVSEYYVKYDAVALYSRRNKEGGVEQFPLYDFAVDISERRTTDAFIETTHERYRAFCHGLLHGKVSAVFTDEPTPGRPLFPEGFSDRFFDRFGYDILDHLPSIVDRSRAAGPDDEQARIDYDNLCADVMADAYFLPIRDWCRNLGIYSCGHLNLDDRADGSVIMNYGNTLHLLRTMDLPGVDVIWRQLWPRDTHSFAGDAPACAEAPSYNFFPRIASSAAAQSGGNLALTESFGVYGDGLTMQQMRWITGCQSVRGVNIMDPMIIPWSDEDFFPCGERPHFSSKNPGYRMLVNYNTDTARSSYLSVVGLRADRPALFFPQDDISAGGDRMENALAAFSALGDSLERRGVDFDIADDRILREGTVDENGVLCVGLARYTAVLFPEGVSVPDDIRAIAASLCGKAEPVALSDDGFRAIRAAKRILPDGSIVYIFFNESACTVRGEFILPDAESAVRADTVSGAFFRQEGEAVAEGFRITLDLYSGQTAYVITGEADLPVRERHAFTRSFMLSSPELCPVRRYTIDRRGAHDMHVKGIPVPTRLGSWREILGEDFSGEADYIFSFTRPEGRIPAARIRLGRTNYAAEVLINGISVGFTVFEPYELTFDPALLREGDNEITVRVANTAAEAHLYNTDESCWEPKHLSTYNERAKEFERESHDGGLYGPVFLDLA